MISSALTVILELLERGDYLPARDRLDTSRAPLDVDPRVAVVLRSICDVLELRAGLQFAQLTRELPGLARSLCRIQPAFQPADRPPGRLLVLPPASPQQDGWRIGALVWREEEQLQRLFTLSARLCRDDDTAGLVVLVRMEYACEVEYATALLGPEQIRRRLPDGAINPTSEFFRSATTELRRAIPVWDSRVDAEPADRYGQANERQPDIGWRVLRDVGGLSGLRERAQQSLPRYQRQPVKAGVPMKAAERRARGFFDDNGMQ